MSVLPHKLLPNVDGSLEKSLTSFAAQTAFTISSCRTPDMPIVYVSSEFCSMTGYTEKEILGQNCRFLQGPGTSRQSVQEIRNAIQEDRGCTVCLMNYTKGGKPFWNQLCLAPVFDDHGIAFYLGIQTNVTGEVLAYRSQQFSPFQTKDAGPHGGVHSFEACPEIVKHEVAQAKKLGITIQRWHSMKLPDLVPRKDFSPVSCHSLPTSLLMPLYKLQQSFVLADPNLPDMPIVHASEGFLRLTGRPRDQVIGHNCRFMQGPQTDKNELQRLREAIRGKQPVTVRLLNYKQDGSTFWNNLLVAPIRNADGEVVFFAGCQLDITLKPEQAKPNSTNQSSPAQNSAPKSLSSRDVSISAKVEDVLQKLTTNETGGGSVANSERLPAEEGTVRFAQQNHTNQNSVPSNANQSQSHPSSDGSQSSMHASNKANGLEGIPEAMSVLHPLAKQKQRSVVGTVRVVCRSLSSKSGLRRSLEDQHRPHGVHDCMARRKKNCNSDVAEGISNKLENSRIDMPTLASAPW